MHPVDGKDVPFETLKGVVLWSVMPDDYKIVFMSADHAWVMYHSQDCCESVSVESIVGDLQDLLLAPILLAEATSSTGPVSEHGDSSTYTFYKLATVKGYVDIRWVGSSNGYYSESVDFVQLY